MAGAGTASSASSKPVTTTSAGTRRPCASPASTPKAIWSFATAIALSSTRRASRVSSARGRMAAQSPVTSSAGHGQAGLGEHGALGRQPLAGVSLWPARRSSRSPVAMGDQVADDRAHADGVVGDDEGPCRRAAVG
jgi:hypothetical protein